MIMEIQKGIQKYELNIESITQVCGQNIRLKNFIRESLMKHFSNSKYADYEKQMLDNVSMNGKEVGREYFKVYSIENISDVIKLIQIQKNSLLLDLIEMELQDYDYQIQIEKINMFLDEILTEMDHRMLEKIGMMNLNYEMKSILDLFKSVYVLGEDNKRLEECGNFELLETLINLLIEVQTKKPQKILLIINNIDHLLEKEEYKKMIDIITPLVCRSDSYVMLFTSIDGYVKINEDLIQGINVINQDVYSFPELEKVVEFIEFHYPVHMKKKEAIKNIKLLEKTIHKVGDENYKEELKSEVLLKMLNESMGIKVKNENKINNIELCFLNQ